MPNYVLAYYGEPKFKNPEDGAKHMAKWRAWSTSLKDSWVNPGSPLEKSKIVSLSGISDDNASDRLTGYSVLKADSLEAAIAIAKKCPHLEHGTIHVAAAMEMEM